MTFLINAKIMNPKIKKGAFSKNVPFYGLQIGITFKVKKIVLGLRYKDAPFLILLQINKYVIKYVFGIITTFILLIQDTINLII